VHCIACDRPLTPFEATIKLASTGEHLDMCNWCLDPIRDEIEIIERYDLLGQGDVGE
jgi:hypothetical protein